MRAQEVIVSGEGLTIGQVVSVSRGMAKVTITQDAAVRERVRKSNEYILEAVADDQPIYGVTSGFGAMANKRISREQAVALQNNIPWFHKVGGGSRRVADFDPGMNTDPFRGKRRR